MTVKISAMTAATTPLAGTEEFEVNQSGNTRKATMANIEAAIDHGSIGGLTDDDHTQYILVNGTRNFSGAVTFDAGFTLGGHTPTDILISTDGASTSDTALVTPGWIDANVSGGGGGVTALSVTDIDDPSTELNAISGSAKGDLRLCYETNAGTDEWTLYAWDDADSGAENVPFEVDGATGRWSAVAGKYANAGARFPSNTRLALDNDQDTYIQCASDDDLRFYTANSYQLRIRSTIINTYVQLDVDGDLTVSGALNHDGSTVGFYGTTPVAQSAAYAPTNVATDRTFDANSTTLAELADVLGTLIADLQATGLIG